MIPGQGTKIPQASWPKNKNIKKKKKSRSNTVTNNKDFKKKKKVTLGKKQGAEDFMLSPNYFGRTVVAKCL